MKSQKEAMHKLGVFPELYVSFTMQYKATFYVS